MRPVVLELEAVAYDTLAIGPGQSTGTFFQDRTQSAPDETGRPEKELVRWLMAEPIPRSLLLKKIALDGAAKDAQGVIRPFITNPETPPGDIDLLLAVPNAPHRAVALECKRVRVRAGENDGQRVNRLEGVGRAVVQVEGLCKIGFSLTYLAMIAIAHDLSDTDYNFLFRGPRETTFTRIVHVLEELPLPEPVGILYVEIAQPVSASIDTAAVICAGILRRARVCDQTNDLSMTVARFFQRRPRGASAGG